MQVDPFHEMHHDHHRKGVRGQRVNYVQSLHPGSITKSRELELKRQMVLRTNDRTMGGHACVLTPVVTFASQEATEGSWCVHHLTTYSCTDESK